MSLIKINFFLLFSPRVSFLAKLMSFVRVYFCNKVIFHHSFSTHLHVEKEMGELLGFTWQTKVITWTVGKFSECVTGGILPWIGNVLDLFTDKLHYPRNDTAVAMQLLWVGPGEYGTGNYGCEQERCSYYFTTIHQQHLNGGWWRSCFKLAHWLAAEVQKINVSRISGSRVEKWQSSEPWKKTDIPRRGIGVFYVA